jgi:hypothetical protein
VLFLYRPRQTWMPYRTPRPPTQQVAYNHELQEKFSATHRVPPSMPSPDNGSTRGDAVVSRDQHVTTRLKELAQLRADGSLSDDEFSAAKAKVLGTLPAS